MLKEGLTDNDAVDESRLLLATLRQLEPVHLRVFALIAGSQLHPEGSPGESVEVPMTVEALEQAWPQGRFVLSAVLAVLEGVGLIKLDMFSPDQLRNPDRYKPQGWMLPTDIQEGWASTIYGTRLRRFLEN